MRFLSIKTTIFSALILSSTTAKLHHLFVGNLGQPASIYALTFDASTHDLTLTKNITAGSPHPWISFSPDKRNLYGVSFSTSGLSSYSVVDNGNDLRLDRVLQTHTQCRSNDTFAHIVSHPRENAIYTAPWGGEPACYLVASTLENGTLDAVVQNGVYSNASGIHGLALRPGTTESSLYAADTHTDVIWSHSILPDGKLSFPTPKNVSHDGKAPRHLATHPNGKWLYAVFEAGNSVSAYPLDPETGLPGNTTTRFSILPSLSNTSTNSESPPLDARWWGAEITISPSGRLLWASTRAKDGSSDTGFITAFSLADDGRIIERLTVQPTSTKVGLANSVSVAPDTDEFLAMTDWKGAKVKGNGYVQIWKVEGLPEFADKRDSGATRKRSMSALSMREAARVDIKDEGGCCANVVWYD